MSFRRKNNNQPIRNKGDCKKKKKKDVEPSWNAISHGGIRERVEKDIFFLRRNSYLRLPDFLRALPSRMKGKTKKGLTAVTPQGKPPAILETDYIP